MTHYPSNMSPGLVLRTRDGMNESVHALKYDKFTKQFENHAGMKTFFDFTRQLQAAYNYTWNSRVVREPAFDDFYFEPIWVEGQG